MNCAQIRAALPEFVYGGLTLEMQSQVKSHLNGCPECRREVGRSASGAPLVDCGAGPRSSR